MTIAPERAVFEDRRETVQRATVIVMSHDAGEREDLQALLEGDRYSILACVSVDDVISTMRAADVAIIVAVCDRADNEALSLCWKANEISDTRVLLLARRGVEGPDRIFALEAGADDLLAYPPNPREFVALVGARTRRFDAKSSVDEDLGAKDRWMIDGDTRSVVNAKGERVVLSKSELALLDIFVDRPGRVIEAEEAIAKLDVNVTNAAVGFRMAVSRLRRKLTGVGASDLIRCVRGEGYVLDGPLHHRGQETAFG